MTVTAMTARARRMLLTRVGVWALLLGLAGCATWQPPTTPVTVKPDAAAAATATSVTHPTKPAWQRIGAAKDGAGTATEDVAGKPGDEVVPPLDYEHNVYFPLGSHALDSKAMIALKRHAKRLNADPRLVVTLIGHTDDLGSLEYNDALCLKRAKAVEQALLDLGVSPRQIHIAPRYGYEKAPGQPCRTEACRRALRKVELHYPS